MVNKNVIPISNFKGIKTPSMLYSMFAWRKAKDITKPDNGDCDICGGVGMITSNYTSPENPNGLMYCLCSVRDYAQDLIKNGDGFLSIHPERYIHTLQVDERDQSRTSMTYVKGKMETWMNWPPLNVAFLGNTGTGKTHILSAIATAFYPFAAYVSVSDLESMVYRTLKEDDETARLEDFLKSVPILLLDDIGAENGSDFMISMLYRVVDHRYRLYASSSDLLTVSASNLSMAELDSSKYFRVGQRLTDVKTTAVFNISGNNFRRPSK